MKKFLAVFIAFAVAFSFGSSIKTEAMSNFDESTDLKDFQGNTYHVAKSSIADASIMSDGQLEGIQIELTSYSMIRGEEQTVRVIGLYSGGVKKPISSTDVEWTTSKSNVATISSGKLQAVAAGETTLIARYQNEMAFETIYVQDFKELPHKTNIAVGKIWNVKFNGPIDIQTVGNIVVMDSDGLVIPVSYDYINNYSEPIVRIIPKQDYIPGKSYTLWVKDVRSLSGKSLNQYTKMDFTIKK